MADFTKMKARIAKLKIEQRTKPSGVLDQKNQMVSGNPSIRRYLSLKRQLANVLAINGDTDSITAEMDAIWTSLTAKEKAAITKETTEDGVL